MNRREFITLLGGAAILRPLAAAAQQSERMRRIGVLVGLSPDASKFELVTPVRPAAPPAWRP
jgi:putative ABC transport system substrate-binding protein